MGLFQICVWCSSWWGGLDIDFKNIVDVWSFSEWEFVFQSFELWKEYKLSFIDRRVLDFVFQLKSFEFIKLGFWEFEFG